jgi:hypothetical protein
VLAAIAGNCLPSSSRFHYDLRANPTQTFFIVTFADTFLTPLIGTALAPSGKLLVASVAASIMSMPSIFMLVVVAFMRTHFGDYDGHAYQDLNQMMCVSVSFFLGAISSFILIVLVLSVRRRRIHSADS